MNHLLLGKNAIVNAHGRRLGPPKGAVPPARTKTRQKESPEIETLHWKDAPKVKVARRTSVDEENRNEEVYADTDSSSYSEDDSSSTSTELCDEHEKISDYEGEEKSEFSRKLEKIGDGCKGLGKIAEDCDGGEKRFVSNASVEEQEEIEGDEEKRDAEKELTKVDETASTQGEFELRSESVVSTKTDGSPMEFEEHLTKSQPVIMKLDSADQKEERLKILDDNFQEYVAKFVGPEFVITKAVEKEISSPQGDELVENDEKLKEKPKVEEFVDEIQWAAKFDSSPRDERILESHKQSEEQSMPEEAQMQEKSDKEIKEVLEVREVGETKEISPRRREAERRRQEMEKILSDNSFLIQSSPKKHALKTHQNLLEFTPDSSPKKIENIQQQMEEFLTKNNFLLSSSPSKKLQKFDEAIEEKLTPLRSPNPTVSQEPKDELDVKLAVSLPTSPNFKLKSPDVQKFSYSSFYALNEEPKQELTIKPAMSLPASPNLIKSPGKDKFSYITNLQEIKDEKSSSTSTGSDLSNKTDEAKIKICFDLESLEKDKGEMEDLCQNLTKNDTSKSFEPIKTTPKEECCTSPFEAASGPKGTTSIEIEIEEVERSLEIKDYGDKKEGSFDLTDEYDRSHTKKSEGTLEEISSSCFNESSKIHFDLPLGKSPSETQKIPIIQKDDKDFDLFLEERVKIMRQSNSAETLSSPTICSNEESLKTIDVYIEDFSEDMSVGSEDMYLQPDFLSAEDKRLEAGRRNSERALKIIQENSLILHRILQHQSKSTEIDDSKDASPIKKSFTRSDSLPNDIKNRKKVPRSPQNSLDLNLSKCPIKENEDLKKEVPKIFDETPLRRKHFRKSSPDEAISLPPSKFDRFRRANTEIISQKPKETDLYRRSLNLEDMRKKYELKKDSRDGIEEFLSRSAKELQHLDRQEKAKLRHRRSMQDTSYRRSLNLEDLRKKQEQKEVRKTETIDEFLSRTSSEIEEMEKRETRSLERNQRPFDGYLDGKILEDQHTSKSERFSRSLERKEFTYEDYLEKADDYAKKIRDESLERSYKKLDPERRLSHPPKRPDDLMLAVDKYQSRPDYLPADLKLVEKAMNLSSDDYRHYEDDFVEKPSYLGRKYLESPRRRSLSKERASIDNIAERKLSYDYHQKDLEEDSKKFLLEQSNFERDLEILFKKEIVQSKDETPDASSLFDHQKLAKEIEELTLMERQQRIEELLQSPQDFKYLDRHKKSPSKEDLERRLRVENILNSPVEEKPFFEDIDRRKKLAILPSPVFEKSASSEEHSLDKCTYDNNTKKSAQLPSYSKSDRLNLSINLKSTTAQPSPEISPQNVSCLQFTTFQKDLPCTSKFSPICTKDKNPSPKTGEAKPFGINLPTLSPPRRSSRSPLSPQKIFSPFPVQPTTRQPKEIGVKLGLYKDLSPLKSPSKW